MMQQATLFEPTEQDIIYAAIAATTNWLYPSDIRRAAGYERRRDIQPALDALIEGGTIEAGRAYIGTATLSKGYLGFRNIYRAKRKETQV